MLLLFFVAIAGCKKDDEDNGNSGGGDNPAQSNYRLTESVSTEEGVEPSKDVYSYDSDKLSQVIEYTQPSKGDWVEVSKTVVSYPSDNSFEMVTSDYINGEWSLSEKEVITHQNGLWEMDMVYEYNGADWVSESKAVYTYIDNKISKEEGFEYFDGEMENEYKYLYSYVGDTPSAVEKYQWDDGDWLFTGKDTLTFSNGKLAKFESSYLVEGTEILVKYEYSYTGDLASSISISYYMYNMWINAGTISFTYDEHNNMIKMDATGEYLSFVDTFTYEEGSSNWALINGKPGFFYFYGMEYAKLSGKINNEISKVVKSVLSQR